MARPAEKARAMLNKWVAMRDGEDSKDDKRRKQSRRPFLASECDNLSDAERFRNQIVHEISDLLSKLQNPAAPEHTVREWNDDVNKKLREKYHWNNQIYKLGGIDYNALEKKRRIEEGDIQIHYSYRYFGVAKNLPGVKELLEKEAANLRKSKSKQQKSTDIFKHITPDYFGWRDEEDGILLEMEEVDQQQQSSSNKRQKVLNEPSTSISSSQRIFRNDIHDYFDTVPTQDDIAKMLLEQRKKELLEKYKL